MKTFFVWLGSKRAEKRGVGIEGSLLDRAAKASLPVPNGAILLHELLEALVDDGTVVLENGRYTAPNPQELSEALFTAVRLPRFDKVVTVRSVFSAPVSKKTIERMAETAVDSDEPERLANALCHIWSNHPKDESIRRDVLLLEEIQGVNVGTAYTESNYATDSVTLDSTGEHMPPLFLPQLSGGEATTQSVPPFAQRLQKLLRGIRRTFAESDWQVKWIDDGSICWLTSVLPIDTAVYRQTLFKKLPAISTAATSNSGLPGLLTVEAGRQLLNHLHEIDNNLPKEVPLVVSVANQPYLNLSLLYDVAARWGIEASYPEAKQMLPLTKGRPLRQLRHIVQIRRWRSVAETAVAHLPDDPPNSFTAHIELLLTQIGKNLFQHIQLLPEEKASPTTNFDQEIARQFQQLSQHSQQAVVNSQLPTADAIWLLTPDEVRQLDDKFVLSNQEAQEREARQKKQTGKLTEKFLTFEI